MSEVVYQVRVGRHGYGVQVILDGVDHGGLHYDGSSHASAIGIARSLAAAASDEDHIEVASAVPYHAASGVRHYRDGQRANH